MKIDHRFFTAIAVFIFLPIISVLAQKSGEATFKESCSSCHTIGKGKLVGPDLANVEKTRSVDWILKFVKSSQTVIHSGDKYADSLFKSFNQMVMPDHPDMTDDQIKGILAYITEKSSAPTTATATVAALPGNSNRGRNLFDGKIRFTNSGPACNSCHNVDMKGYMSGGALGKDLTHAISRLSAPGVSGIISGLPFPQMKESFGTKPVTSQEIADITAFLTTADKQISVKAISNVGNYLLAGGVVGIIILLVLFSIFWIKRKNKTVNLSIYKRQIKSA